MAIIGRRLFHHKEEPPAEAISPQQAIALALSENAEIQYDYQAQAPFFNYYDAAGIYMKFGLKMREVFKQNLI